jgi:hypothetical protein
MWFNAVVFKTGIILRIRYKENADFKWHKDSEDPALVATKQVCRRERERKCARNRCALPTVEAHVTEGWCQSTRPWLSVHGYMRTDGCVEET